METKDLLLASFIGIIVLSLVVFIAVRLATAESRKYQRILIRMLDHISRKAGVTEDDLNNTYIDEK